MQYMGAFTDAPPFKNVNGDHKKSGVWSMATASDLVTYIGMCNRYRHPLGTRSPCAQQPERLARVNNPIDYLPYTSRSPSHLTRRKPRGTLIPSSPSLPSHGAKAVAVGFCPRSPAAVTAGCFRCRCRNGQRSSSGEGSGGVAVARCAQALSG